MSVPSSGTQGWYSCEALSKRRVGVPGPDASDPLEGSPRYFSVKFRTHGRHKDHLSVWEWDTERDSWMLLVLDERRSIVGQVFGRTQEACHRKMNAIYEAKGLGVYNGKYAAKQAAPSVPSVSAHNLPLSKASRRL